MGSDDQILIYMHHTNDNDESEVVYELNIFYTLDIDLLTADKI